MSIPALCSIFRTAFSLMYIFSGLIYPQFMERGGNANVTTISAFPYVTKKAFRSIWLRKLLF